MPSVWVSMLGGGDALGTARGSCLRAALRLCTKAAAVGQPGQHPAAKCLPFLPLFPGVRGSVARGQGGWRCRQALASPGTSDRAIERRRARIVPCPRAASSPFVYHTSCLLFCLLHTSSPSLIVLPAPHLDFQLAMGNSNYLRHKKKIK